MHRLVIGLTSLLAVAGGAVVGGYLFLSSAGIDHTADLVPAQRDAYVCVYLQPSTAQQTKLAALIGRLPGFEDPAGPRHEDRPDGSQRAQRLGPHYETDIRPWIGGQLAIGAWQTPGTTRASRPALARPRRRGEGSSRCAGAIGRLVQRARGTTETTYQGVTWS